MKEKTPQEKKAQGYARIVVMVTVLTTKPHATRSRRERLR